MTTAGTLAQDLPRWPAADLEAEAHGERGLGAVGDEQDEEGAADDPPPVEEPGGQRSPSAGRLAGAASGCAIERRVSSIVGARPLVAVGSMRIRLLSRSTAPRMRAVASSICCTQPASFVPAVIDRKSVV